MKIKKLNLREALQLASIVSKYVDIKNPLEESAFDFIDEIIQKISPEEYLYLVSMMINNTEEYVKKIDAMDILALFTEGLATNKITTLLGFYKNLKNDNS